MTALNSFQKILVIGASSGGIEPLKELVRHLPTDFPAPVLIVWHSAPDARGVLAGVLDKLNTLPAVLATDKELLQPSRIYIAPPDHHMVIEQGSIRITQGPKENRFRPAIDPLFRSAAYEFGSRTIGIVLSGALDDGTAGLWTIKRRGGVAIVQEPSEATVAAMPLNAMEAVDIDYKMPVADIATLLIKLCSNKNPTTMKPAQTTPPPDDESNRTNLELAIARGEFVEDEKLLQLGDRSPFTCPDCHGVLTAIRKGGRTRFRCHTGHAFSENSLLSALRETIENNLWSAVRGMEETKFLLNFMGDQFSSANQPLMAADYFNLAREAAEKADKVKKIIYTPNLNDNIETPAT